MDWELSILDKQLEAHGMATDQAHLVLGWVDTGAGNARMDEVAGGIAITGRPAAVVQWLINECPTEDVAMNLVQDGGWTPVD